MSHNPHNPEATRNALLRSAATQFHSHGFQAASLDAILAETGVTKGALYHHFRNKQELGLAVLTEVYRKEMLSEWTAALEQGDQPVDALLSLVGRKRSSLSVRSIEHGCPINNLAQEMADVDETFRLAIEAIMVSWRDMITTALARGRLSGNVHDDVDCAAEAVFITSVIEGAMGAAKSARDPGLLGAALTVLSAHIEALRPTRMAGNPMPG